MVEAGTVPLAEVRADAPTLDDTRRREGPELSGREPGRGAMVDRYLVVEKIGAGGMGVVYAAFDPYLDRKVALKLLPAASLGAESAAESKARLLREAQAMARLSHPNVVAVHDVGIAGEQVFVAMEYVRGKPLRDWLEAERRRPGDVIAMFLQAGRGLAAAHAAGIVHRDFKPDNVMVGDDGSVRVLDFGLARSPEQPTNAAPPSDPLAPTDSMQGSALAMQLTQAGALMGTPAYMAPEQIRRGAVDARTDQFGFCAALYEGLHGELPFGGDRLSDLFDAIVAGRVRPPPAKSDVPGWVHRIVLRGLSVKPEDRFPSMDALLQALASDPARTRRVRLAGAALALAVVGGVVALALHRPAAVCGGAEAHLAGAWDVESREKMRAAFLATGVPYATDAWNGVEQRLDTYARSWTRMHTEACEATSVRHEQSAALLDLRMACLGGRLRELRAVSGVLARADAKVVESAVEAVDRMSSIDACADADALLRGVQPPADPGTRREVEELRGTLAQVDALERAGKVADALALIGETDARARSVAYTPVQAEARYWLGLMQGRAGNVAASGQSLSEAIALADEAHDDASAAEAWIQVVFVSGRQARYEEALWHATIARGAARRVRDPRLEARLDNNLGTIFKLMGRFREAADHLTRAIDFWQRTGGADSVALVRPLYNLGTVLRAQGRRAEAQEQFERCLRIREKVFGPSHPSVAYPLIGSGNVAVELGHYDLARERLERALGIWEKTLGPEHANTGSAHHSLGELHRRSGALDLALEQHRRALSIAEKALGPKHPDAAAPLTGLGRVHLDKGDSALAAGFLERALALREANTVEPNDLAETRFALARALAASGGDRKRATRLAEQARDAYAALGEGRSAEHAEASAWLAANP